MIRYIFDILTFPVYWLCDCVRYSTTISNWWTELKTNNNYRAGAVIVLTVVMTIVIFSMYAIQGLPRSTSPLVSGSQAVVQTVTISLAEHDISFAGIGNRLFLGEYFDEEVETEAEAASVPLKEIKSSSWWPIFILFFMWPFSFLCLVLSRRDEVWRFFTKPREWKKTEAITATVDSGSTAPTASSGWGILDWIRHTSYELFNGGLGSMLKRLFGRV